MDDATSRRAERLRDQRERALGTWALVVLDAASTRAELERIRRALRVHRRDRELLSSKLPGEVRRGARVDLEPLLTRLAAAGCRAELRQRQTGGDDAVTPPDEPPAGQSAAAESRSGVPPADPSRP